MEFPQAKRYRKIEIPLNPLQRKTPTEEQVAKIGQDLKKLKPTCLDSFFGGVRSILDKYIPTNPPNTKVKKKPFIVLHSQRKSSPRLKRKSRF